MLSIKDLNFNSELYFQRGKDVLTGKREVMGWDLSPKAQHTLSEAPEHRHGSSMYRRRYAALKAALNTVTVNN